MALPIRAEHSACRFDSGGLHALYHIADDEPFPQFELVSVPVDVPADEQFLSMDIQSGVCASLDSSGALLVREIESDALLLRDHIANPHKVFLHPSGSHLIVFSRDGELYYFAPHDRRVRASLRLQTAASTAGASTGAGGEGSSSSAFTRSLRSSTGSALAPGSPLGTASSGKSSAQGQLVGECVAWVANELCGQASGDVANVEYVYAIIGCHRDATVLVLELAVGVSSKGPSMRCFRFPSPPQLLATLPVASVLLEPWLEPSNGTTRGCYCVLSNASQLFRVALDITTSGTTRKPGNTVALLVAALESGAAAWELKEYPYVQEVTMGTVAAAPLWGSLSVFRPSSAAPVHAYAWTNSVGVLHGVLTASAQDGASLFACEHFISFGNMGRSGKSGGHAEERDAPALFPVGTPTMVVPTAFHLVLLFPRRCIVLNQPPGLCWDTKATRTLASATTAAATASEPSAGRRREQGIQLAEMLSRVRFDPLRNARQPVSVSGLVRDADERRLYVYGARQLWTLHVDGESRRQWRPFLERALDVEKHTPALRARLFGAAHRLAQGRPAAHSLVQFLRGQFYLQDGDDTAEATTVLATCDWFDEVYGLLRQVSVSSSSSSPSVLTSFLTKRFSRLARLARLYERAADKSGQVPASSRAASPEPERSAGPPPLAGLLPQLAALVALLVVEKLDAATRQVPAPSASVGDDAGPALEAFLAQAAVEAPRLFACPGFPALVLQLLEEQGRQDCALRLAAFTGQHAYVVAYHVALGHHAKAVEVLAKYSAGRSEMASVWYAHASVLMAARPVALVTAMLRTMFKDEQAGRPQLLELTRLLPALARYEPSSNEVEGNEENQVVVLLEQGLTRFHCVSTAVHTFYLALLAKLHDTERLEEFISGSLFYDHNYALRECLRHGNAQACILLYKQLRLYEDAVKMALRQAPPASAPSASWPGLTQAEDILRGVGGKVSEETVKRLWLLTAEYAMRQRGVQAALAVVEDSGRVLHLDDVLGKISDDTVVQELKGVLMASLDRYTDEGATLRRRQEEAYQTAETVKHELSRLRHQYGYVAGHQRCLLCSRPLLQGAEPYVLYPSCQHVVHESCGVARLEAMGGLEAFFTDEGIAPYVLSGVCSLEELVHVDCVVCGEAAIVELDIPLCEEDPTWKI